MNSKFLKEYAQACVAAEESENLKQDYSSAYSAYQELQAVLTGKPNQAAFTGWSTVYARPKVQELVKSLAEYDDFVFIIEMSVTQKNARLGLAFPKQDDTSKGFIKFGE
jgi:hypothetical protein